MGNPCQSSMWVFAGITLLSTDGGERRGKGIARSKSAGPEQPAPMRVAYAAQGAQQ